mmetsp:Transcript_175956/g.558981  ORF Transcript_175956/g.558981 Transcript_175956/m.558981 type:complete len:236 (+) Transcript_175956:566-1273(+)
MRTGSSTSMGSCLSDRRWAAGPRRLHGLTNPTMFSSPVPRSTLAVIKDLRVVLITCDLLSRLEKNFWEYHYCHADVRVPAGGSCRPSIAAVLEEPDAFLAPKLVRPHLAEMADLFGSRLLVLHQQQLRADPRRTFDTVAAFLGASPFPSSTTFRRYNSRRGQRTDLCRNASLARRLQRRLASDYEFMERLLQAAGYRDPQRVSRKTRCERPDEVRDDAVSCGQHEPCPNGHGDIT